MRIRPLELRGRDGVPDAERESDFSLLVLEPKDRDTLGDPEN